MNWHFVNRCEQAIAYEADLPATMATLGSWGWLLKNFLEKHPVDQNILQPSNGMAARYPPRLDDLPWLGKWKHEGKLPFPFVDKEDWHLKVDTQYRLVGWDEWLETLIADMSCADFLSESSWCGYWSFERRGQNGLPAIEFADAIEELTIRALNFVDNPEQNTRRIIGAYPEHHLDFHLEGYITPSGRFKLGPPGEFWALMGWMTPFGLFGLWGELGYE